MGEQSAVVLNSLYLIPFAASASSVGVGIGPPNALEAPKPTSSVRMSKMLGAPAGGWIGCGKSGFEFSRRSPDLALEDRVRERQHGNARRSRWLVASCSDLHVADDEDAHQGQKGRGPQGRLALSKHVRSLVLARACLHLLREANHPGRAFPGRRVIIPWALRALTSGSPKIGAECGCRRFRSKRAQKFT